MKFTWKQWTLVFLPITAIAIVMELWAALDNNGESVPWTQYIVNYIPAEIGIFLVGGFGIWVIYHFMYWYSKNEK